MGRDVLVHGRDQKKRAQPRKLNTVNFEKRERLVPGVCSTIKRNMKICSGRDDEYRSDDIIVSHSRIIERSSAPVLLTKSINNGKGSSKKEETNEAECLPAPSRIRII